jgi:hypothetical protein
MSEANEALRAELAAQAVGRGEALRGEYDGVLAALGGRVAVRAGRAGATLSDVVVARRLFRLVTALGLEGRLFLGRRPAPSHRHPAGAVVRVTWAAGGPAPARHGLRYARAFVRGATLGAGYLGDPRRGYNLEWNLDPVAADGGADELLAQQLLRLGVAARQAPGRRGGVRLYVKGGEAVGDLLVQLGADESVLSWENARALRAMRGRIHREVNAEAANLRRAARTGVRQAEAVRALIEQAGSRLPPALASAARARLDHPEASLEELALVLGLSKSGTNQRMRRLMAMAAALGLGGGENDGRRRRKSPHL